VGIQRHLRVVATTRMTPLHMHMYWIPAATTELTIVNGTPATTTVDVGLDQPVYVDANARGPYNATMSKRPVPKRTASGHATSTTTPSRPPVNTWNVLWP